MRIVVLDGYTINPGDLSWQELEKLGECVIHEHTPRELAVGRARGAEAVLTSKVAMDRQTLAQLPDLRYIGVLATGYNIVDVRAAADMGITVTNVPAYSTDSVAQMTFAHILNLTQQLAYHCAGVRDGDWCRARDFCYWEKPLVELPGLTLGILGYGRIGRAVGTIAKAFGLRVVAYSPSLSGAGAEGVEAATHVRDVFSRADILTLHCPLTTETQRIVTAETLALMKPTALLVNTSRGGLVDENALAHALATGRIGGAGLDVLTLEPPSPENPLFSAPNCYITPHIGWATKEARERLLQTVARNVAAFIAGNPRNTVGDSDKGTC